MPRKEELPQINLKLPVPDYTLLQAEAARAGVAVNTYARQLVLTRGRQPLAAEAAAVQAHYQPREAAHKELLSEYAHAAAQAKRLAQQQTYFREQFRLLQYYLAKGELAQAEQAVSDALATPLIHVVLPGEAAPSLPPDPLADAPRV
ncbi:hypothetical protein [Hymenobacter sp. YC55]|uniref:hypothetical protein n=1 Tax=Hymenobacter sp. YC55 TaxID=3034019 RepID=UPI0023F851AA|nr:hypothetical protein [Hymenobacter sp. YC55]MDF7815217.1 hypothetical protein [Hymenobacter sp. YC55]